MNIFTWIIYFLFLIINIGFSYGIIRSIQKKKSFSHSILIQSLLFWIALIYFYLNPDLSKLNMLWIFPLLFVIGLFLGTKIFIKK